MTPRNLVDPRKAARTGTTAPDRTDTRPTTGGPQAVSGQHSQDVGALLKRIQELEEQVKTQQMTGLPRTPGMRVGPSGTISLYGIHANFPVSLYVEQWERLFEQQERVREFAEANKELLDMKDDTPEQLEEKATKRAELGIVPRRPETVRRDLVVTAANARKLEVA